jgi:uncharacterized membrane protein YhaH (DUF805 family)
MYWYLKVWRQYADFSGRARRKEYWMCILFNLVFMFAAGFIAGLLVALTQSEGIFHVFISLEVLYGLAFFIPCLAVTVRRLHDTGNSGWWVLSMIMPLIGIIVILSFTLLNSQPGSNEWGPNPKEESPYDDYNNRGNRYGPVRETSRDQHGYEERASPVVRSSITLGRSRSSDICIDDRYEDVSRDHARIRQEGTTFILEDNSTNGSYVNGQKINRSHRVIQRSDEIRLGRNYVLSWDEIRRFFPDAGRSRDTQRRNKYY